MVCRDCGKDTPNSRHCYHQNRFQKERSEILFKQRKYRSENKERCAEISHKHYEKNKEYYKTQTMLWRKANPVKWADQVRRRRARESKIIDDFTSQEWAQKLNGTEGLCQRCFNYVGILNLTLDHIYPISNAFEDWKKTGEKQVYSIDDVIPLCASCNSSKRFKAFI